MSVNTAHGLLARTARWGAALVAAGTLLAATAGTAQAAGPVSGTEAVITVGNRQATPTVSPDGTTAYVVTADAKDNLVLAVVDTRSGAITGQLALGANRWTVYTALSADGSRLYVLNYLSLSIVDVPTLTLLGTTALPDQPRPADWRVGAPGGLALSPDGSTAYVSQFGPQTAGRIAPGRVLAFAPAQRAFTASVPLPAAIPEDLAVRPDGRDLYIGSEAGVLHLDTSGGAPSVTRVVPGTETTKDSHLTLSPNGHLFAVNGAGAGTGDEIDPATDTVTRRLTLTPGSASLLHPRVSPDGRRLYVVDNSMEKGPSVITVDTATGTVVPEEALALNEESVDGMVLGPDGHTLYAGGRVVSMGYLQILNF
ncbi:hypothetical protein [Kitasatospora aureofaciens]|uniref:hypothetical protein n=1 Tax=Kitasatospora aureofaciens TaxID=1894 RepID=UPI001C489851|nr:hypothetical protein [Kitasatospora aureofaciens]MBV6699149.1 hypothetical protein [Kitasatospora aureofaciens]